LSNTLLIPPIAFTVGKPDEVNAFMAKKFTDSCTGIILAMAMIELSTTDKETAISAGIL
jgi:hypothetical protein